MTICFPFVGAPQSSSPDPRVFLLISSYCNYHHTNSKYVMVCSPDSYLGDSSLHMLWRSTFKSITETCDKEMGTRQGKILFVPIFDLLSTFMGPFLDIFILINRRSAIQSTSLTSRLNSSTGDILSNMQDEPLFIMCPLYVHISWSPAESCDWSERPGLAAVASRPSGPPENTPATVAEAVAGWEPSG